MKPLPKKKIGFIGLGTMGKPMAANIAKANFPLTVYDVRKEPVAEMEKLGAKVAKSARQVGKECDTVVVMVINYPQVKEVVFPPEGVLSELSSGSTLIIASTLSPSEVEEVEEMARGKGVGVIDSPVSGGQERAQDGSLTLMVGADRKVFAENEEVLKAMGKYIYHMGKVGQGQTLKLVNQMLVVANIVSVAEALTMAKKLGMDMQGLVDIISKCTGDSWALREVAPRMIAGNFEAKGAVKTMTKDTRSIMNTGMKARVPLFISSIAYNLYGILESRGFNEQDISSVVTIFEEYAGVKVSDC